MAKKVKNVEENGDKVEEKWRVKGGGGVGGSLRGEQTQLSSAWRRRGWGGSGALEAVRHRGAAWTVRLAEKGKRYICGCGRLGDLCSAKEVETFDNLFSEHLSCNLTWGLEMLLDQYCPNYVGYQQQTGSRDFNCQFFPQKFWVKSESTPVFLSKNLSLERKIATNLTSR